MGDELVSARRQNKNKNNNFVVVRTNNYKISYIKLIKPINLNIQNY